MNCEKVKSLLSDYIDNGLAEPEKREIEKHLKGCGYCKNEFELMQKCKDLCKNAGNAPLPMYFDENLMDKIDDFAKQQRSIYIKRPWAYSSAAAAVICIVFMWNFIYSTYMNNKTVYNPPLITNTQPPQKTGTSEFVANPGMLGVGQEPEAAASEAPSEMPAVREKEIPATQKKPKINPPAQNSGRSGGAADAANAPVVASIDEPVSPARIVPGGPATAHAAEKSTFVATSKADEVIAWINENLSPMGTRSSKGYTIINLSEKDFYKLKVIVPLFGGTTTDISENAPYADIVDYSGDYSAVIYNP